MDDTGLTAPSGTPAQESETPRGPPPEEAGADPASALSVEGADPNFEVDTKAAPAESAKEEVLKNLLAGLTTSFAAIALGAAFGDASGRGALVGILSAGMIAFFTATLGGTRVQCSGPTAPMTTVTTLIVTFSRTKLFDTVNTHYNSSSPGCDQDAYDSTLCPLPDHFVNLVLIMGAIMIFFMGVCQTGMIIKKVPNVVISGFMNGIAVQIWAGQVTKVVGTIENTKPRMRGDWMLNLPFVVGTTVLCFYLGGIIKKLLPPKIAKKVPGTLCVIIIMTLVAIFIEDCVACHDCSGCIEKTQLGAKIDSLDDMKKLISSQIPSRETIETEGLFVEAFMFSLQLAVLCYLDTLLTSLVVDKLNGEQTAKNKELAAQGIANGAVTLFGGLPGAQATIRSVLILKEGATMRLAGMSAGIFVIIEMLLLQKLVKLIPQAVFCGILFKIGYDVFDFVPFSIYLKGCVEGVLDKCASTEALQTSHESATEKFLACDKEDVLAYRLARGKMERYSNALISRGVSVTMLNETELAQRQEQRASSGDLRASASPRDMIVKATKKAGYNAFNKVVDRNQPLPSVNHAEMFFIMGTTIVTVTVNLNVAVVGFTLLFHAVKIASKKFDAFKGIDLSDLATISLDEDSARV